MGKDEGTADERPPLLALARFLTAAAPAGYDAERRNLRDEVHLARVVRSTCRCNNCN